VIGKVWPRGVAFKPYTHGDEDFALTNCIAVLDERSDLVEALRGSGGPW
jgi:hypothetical protein